MFENLCYKEAHDDLFSFRYMQVAKHYELDFDTINEDDFHLLIQKISQLHEIETIEYAQGIIDTIRILIEQDPPMANILIANDFNSLFSFLIEKNTSIFYCSLYDLLSEIFQKYDGDLSNFVTQDILEFLNILSDENSHIFVSNLKCLKHLLNRDASYKHFFIENGGYFRLLTYEINANILEDKIICIFDIISRILVVQDKENLQNEYINSIDEQNCLLTQIFQSLKIEFNEGKVSTLNCLDIFIRTSFILIEKSVVSEDNLLIYNKEILDKIKVEIMKNIRLYNDKIVYICLDIIILLAKGIFGLDLFDINEIQSNIIIILNAFKESISNQIIQKNSIHTIYHSFELLVHIANDVTVNELISDDIISISIDFVCSDAFKIKSKAVCFLSTLVQMVSYSRACAIIEKFPVLIDIFCDFLHTNKKLLENVISSLGRIVDLSKDQKIPVDIYQIFNLIDIDYLKDLKLNYEVQVQENLSILNLLSGIRYLITVSDQLQAEEED